MNEKKEYPVINWDDKDDIQRLLTVLEIDATSALNNALQFKCILEIFDQNLDFINQAPCFWMAAITLLRYSMLMQTARLFDESKDAIGIKKCLNIFEQSNYKKTAEKVLFTVRNEYEEHRCLIDKVKEFRDKIYAHNDKAEYRDWDNSKDATLDDPIWKDIIELLRWAKSAILALRSTYGDNFPLYYETRNDVKNLFPYKSPLESQNCNEDAENTIPNCD